MITIIVCSQLRCSVPLSLLHHHHHHLLLLLLSIAAPGLSVEQLHHATRVLRLHALVKLRMQRRLMRRLEELVTSEALSLEEFEVLAGDLTSAFRGVPSDLQVHKLQVTVCVCVCVCVFACRV
jgi:hypothetical protein